VLIQVMLTTFPDAFCRGVNLSHNSQLSAVYFSNLPLSADLSRPCITSHLPLILAQIISTDMREVAFDASTLRDPDFMDVLDWDAIAHILQRPNFSHMQRLVVFGISDNILESTKTWIVNRLPAGRARDLVVCCHCTLADLLLAF